MSWWNGYYWVLPYLKFIFVSPVSQTLMHIHVFAKQMYKYTLWVSENWYPLRKITITSVYLPELASVGVSGECTGELGCNICLCWHFVQQLQAVMWGLSQCMLYWVWDVCHVRLGRGWKWRGGRVASLARRNAWLEFQMDLSLSLIVLLLWTAELWLLSRWPT